MPHNYALDLSTDDEVAEERLAMAYARPTMRHTRHPISPTAKFAVLSKPNREARKEQAREAEIENFVGALP